LDPNGDHREPNGEQRASASETQPHEDGRVAGSGLDIQRFARGEIDKAEYEEKKGSSRSVLLLPKRTFLTVNDRQAPSMEAAVKSLFIVNDPPYGTERVYSRSFPAFRS
jgi:hypothetical protein